jgi:hypothetical protein
MTLETRQKLIAIAGDISAFLTILAALPYELGEAATYLPPNAKAWVAGVGVFATLGLRILKRLVDTSPQAQVQPTHQPLK